MKVNQESIIKQISPKIKLVRVEKNYTQDEMANILGISKKTLVQIEKNRAVPTWSIVVTICALFRDSDVIQGVLGDDPLEVLETMAHDTIDRPKDKTLGGKVWWTNIAESNRFVMQQNLISKHYRIIDEQHYRWFSTTDRDEAEQRFKELAE